jgi:predicted MPP superfamily phosphohydrolase
MFACQFLDVSAAALLLVAACAGHTALWTPGLNWVYGLALPRWVQRTLRRLHALAVLASPALFWFGLGFDRSLVLRPYPEMACCPFMAGYTLVCWWVALVGLPFFTVRRLLRRRPAALVSNHNDVVDVVGVLGYKPVGHGKHRLLAHLPWNEVFQVEFAERIFRLARLPAEWDGLTILHLTDLHLCGTPDREFYQYVLDRCLAWGEPDLIVLTGDIVDSYRHHRWVVPLLGRLRWRVAALAILGNHDSWYDPSLVRRRLRRLGMHILSNTWEQLDFRGQPLIVIGHEGPWFKPAPDMSACPDGPFRLCLSHTPDNIRWAQNHQVDLMLSGHNHGGQVRLPLVGSIFVPSRFSRRFDCGTFDESPTLLYVSRGVSGQHPLRFNCRPEVTRIVLRKWV